MDGGPFQRFARGDLLFNPHIFHNTRNNLLQYANCTFDIRITIIKVAPARRACGCLQSVRQKQLRQRKVSCSVWQPPSCGKGIGNDHQCPRWDFDKLVILRNTSWILMTTQQTMKMKRKTWKPGRHIESHDGLSRKNRTAGLGHWRGRDYDLFALCLHISVILYLFNEEMKL